MTTIKKYKILSQINQPADLKNLTTNQLNDAASDICALILDRVSQVGGHLGPNLGIVEITIALHYVFNSPQDKIVWDVSHQCYPHKILTGRREGFEKFKENNDVSGFTNTSESPHDHFNVGHTSTSISLASGLAKARDFQGKNNENIIAVIGDGSLSGGEAFEALDNLEELNSNFIIVVNDNNMSIAENHGGLYGNLKELRETKGKSPHNYFKSLGLDYIYIEDGHDLDLLITQLSQVKDIDHPIVVHIATQKGKGYQFAENSETKENFHFTAPFDLKTGQLASEKTNNNSKATSYNSLLINYLDQKIAQEPNTAIIVPGTPILGKSLRQKYPNNFIDVGIAEEHAIAFASGLAKGGTKPYVVVASTFIQRAYDQIMQDWCLSKTPVSLIVCGSGISSSDYTHVGMYDIPMLSNIPELTYLTPTSDSEFIKMMDWISTQNFPTALRIDRHLAPVVAPEDVPAIQLNQSIITQKGDQIALIGLGHFYELTQKVAALLEEQNGIKPTLINPRFISALDEKMLASLPLRHQKIVTLEDGQLDGGFGEKVTRFYAKNTGVQVYNFGAQKEFIDRIPHPELMKRYHLTPEQVIAQIM